jgi:hypothetical protein
MRRDAYEHARRDQANLGIHCVDVLASWRTQFEDGRQHQQIQVVVGY